MNLMLLMPLGLAALAAWLLPLLLHLARRERQQPVEFAALRWIGARMKPRQRVRFEELPLLLVRLALLAALALLLAAPAREAEGDVAVVAVHPALAGSLPAGLDTDAVRAVWLAPGFPALDAPVPTAPGPTASLLRELDAGLPAGQRLEVHVPARLDGADGAPPRLSRPVGWHVADVPHRGTGDAGAPGAHTAPPLPAQLELHADAAGLRWLRAAVQSLQASDANATPPREFSEADPALRQRIAEGSTAVLGHDRPWPLPAPGIPVWRDADGRVLAIAGSHGKGRVLQLQLPLEPAQLPLLLEAEFPARLAALLAPAPAPPRLATAAAMAPQSGGPAPRPLPQPLDGLMIALVLALFALERWLAAGPRRREAA